MNKRLIIHAEKCNGCGICELVCALSHSKQWHPSLSCIKITADEERHLYFPTVCAQCIEPLCSTACLMNVIQKDVETGLTVRDELSCIGCRACETTCPFSGCTYDYIDGKVVNCNLCQGDPVCVKYCPNGALEFASIEGAAAFKRHDSARYRLIEIFPEG